MEQNLFTRLASEFSVAEVLRPVGPEFDQITPIPAARQMLRDCGIGCGCPCPIKRHTDDSNRPVYVGIVYSDYLLDGEHQVPVSADTTIGAPVGLLDHVRSHYGLETEDDEDEDDSLVSLDERELCVGDFMFPLFPSDLLPSSTSLLSFVLMCAGDEQRSRYVLDGETLIGVVDLRVAATSGEMTLALLALILGIERDALRVCCKCPIESWNALPPQRREPTVDRYNTYRKPRDSAPLVDSPSISKWEARELLRCTMMIDKATILRKRLLLGEESKHAERLFREAERVRNVCAHPSDDTACVIAPNRLPQFLVDCHGLRARLKNRLSDRGHHRNSVGDR